MDVKESASVMKEILGLKYEPIAVQFLEEKTTIEDFEIPDKRHYCQVLMGAREGKKLLLTGDNMFCPAAVWALSFTIKDLERISKENKRKSNAKDTGQSSIQGFNHVNKLGCF